MNRIHKEIVKSLILALLILTSLIQVGILWNQKNHGLPISFFTRLFLPAGVTSEDVDKSKGDYLQPYKIIVSEGLDDNQWLIDRKNKYYEKLWSDARLYISDILSPKQGLKRSEMPYSEEVWSGIAAEKKGFVFEFKSNLGPSLLSWFDTSSSGSSNDALLGIHKMIVLPWEDLNYNSNTIYLLDSDAGKIYKYTISTDKKHLNKDLYEEIFKDLAKNTNLRSYRVIKSVMPDARKKPFPIRDDILIISTGPKHVSLPEITCYIPNTIDGRDISLEELANGILGSDKDNFDFSVDVMDTKVFRNVNNTFRLYSDGVLDYRYLTAVEASDKGSINDAMKNALLFISKRKGMLSGVDHIYLSGINKGVDNYYEFTFDYCVGGMPVQFNFKPKLKDDGPLLNAITIRANSKRVLSCWWIMRSFRQSKETNEFNLRFEYMMDVMFEQNAELKDKINELYIEDIDLCYEVKTGMSEKNIGPAWIIKTKDGRYYPVDIRVNKGD